MKRRFRLLSLAAALVFAGSAFAQSEDVADAEIDAAIQTLKETADPEISVQSGFRFNLTRAKMILARNPEKSLDKVAALLDENIVQIRLNAAIVLTEMARSGYEDPKLVEQLRRCVGESSIAVVYWGLTALTGKGMPDDARREAVAQCLDKTKPEIVRLTAITLAQEREIKSALPWLVEYMKELLPVYDAEVKDRLAIKQIVRGSATDNRTRRNLPAAGFRPGLGPLGTLGGRDRRPTVPPRRPEEAGPVEREVIVGEVDPERDWQDPRILAEHIREFEEIPVVRELHTAGLAVESLAKRDMLDFPFTKARSFEYNPPWKFKPCVEAAVAWLDENRDQFEAWPEPKAAPAAEAEAPVEETDEGGADEPPANDEDD